MKIKYLRPFLCVAAAMPSPAFAGIFADDLGRCVVNSTTEGDRALLVRWMFLTAAANPAFDDLTSISEAERREGYRAAAAVYDRLLLRACRRESVAALRGEGSAGIEAGFQALGQVAGREMMASRESVTALRDLSTYMDGPGLEALGREAGVPAPSGGTQPQGR